MKDQLDELMETEAYLQMDGGDALSGKSQTTGSLEVKNCNNCKMLEWAFGDQNDPEGWICNGRKYKNSLDEAEHQMQLDDKIYRCRPKKCCAPRVKANSCIDGK